MLSVNMDNRKSKRHSVNVTANLVCNDHSHSAKVLDISKGGAKIVLDEGTLTQFNEVTIDLPFLNQLSAIIVWVHGHSCGLKFEDTQNRLEEFLYNLAIYGVKDLRN